MKINKSLIIFIILAVLILADAFFFLPLQVSQLHKMGKKLTEVKKRLEALELDVKNKATYLKRCQALSDELEKVQTKFLTKDDTALIISQINVISKDIGLNISNIRPQALEEISKSEVISFYYLPVDLKFKTGFHKLAVFLNRLEALDFSLDLRQLQIQGEYPDLVIGMKICGIVKE